MGDLFLGKHNALRPGWRAFAVYLATFVGYSLVLWLLPGLRRTPRGVYPLALFAVLLGTSALFLAVEGRSLAALGLRPGPTWVKEFGWGLLGGLAIIGLTAALAFAAGGFRLARNPAEGALTLASGAAFYLVPALNEELTFRGYIFQRVEWSLGRWGALALLSLLFTAAHWTNPGMEGPTRIMASLNITLAGVILGLAYLATRSLALPMGIHVAWNWAQGSLLGFGVSGTTPQGYLTPMFRGRPEWLTGGAFGLEASLPCTGVCVLACLALVLVPWRSQETQP
jgi:hypothetical protein